MDNDERKGGKELLTLVNSSCEIGYCSNGGCFDKQEKEGLKN